MRRSVLIAGGSGLIGSRLTQLLLERDYYVSWLSRSREHKTSFRVCHWDTVKGTIENGAIEQVQHIINLAGASVNSRWTDERKKVIIDSRVDSANLFFETLKARPNSVESYVSASGISFYGNMGDEWMTEDFPPADNFLGTCCRLWEKAACRMETLDIRTTRIRTGLVLAENGGALPKLAGPVKAGIGAALGSGQQWVSWIHIDDLCRMYIHALEHKVVSGAYNGASPHPVTNKGFVTGIAQVLKKPLWLPNVPAFALRAVFGEMSSTVLDSTRASANRILNTSFQFRFPELRLALREIYE